MRASGLSSWILTLATSPVSRAARLAGRLLRSLTLKTGDRVARFSIGGQPVLLPLSHALPGIIRLHPNYDTALPRLAVALAQMQPGREIVAVDVGANVGDTAVALLAAPNLYVVAVEGNDKFLPYLRANLAGLERRSAIVEHFIGPEQPAGLVVRTQRGTAKLEEGADGPALSFIGLDAALAAAGKGEVSLLKIDTDGFDIRIIDSSMGFLERHMPVLFFEFDPNLFTSVTPDGWDVFARLAAIGYKWGIAYLNTGEYLRSFDVSSAEAIADFKTFLGSAHPSAYLDLALFTDPAAFDHFARSERNHFAGQG